MRLILTIFLFLITSAYAEQGYRYGHLTAQEIERVRQVEALLGGVDTKSLRETINELERSRHPYINLEVKEAMAKAYTDIVREINVEGQSKKEWLYSMVCLNMAYLQFGGDEGRPGSTTELNRLIRKKLMEYLPSDLLKQFGSMYSLE